MQGRITFLCLVAILLNACGGGGDTVDGGDNGGSGAGPKPPLVSYTGSTEPALLTKDNGRIFAAVLLDTGDGSVNAPTVRAAFNSPSHNQSQGILRLSTQLSSLIRNGSYPLSLRSFRAAAGTPVDTTEYCNQGSIRYQGALDDKGVGTLTVTYDHCNQDGELQNGVMIFGIKGYDFAYDRFTDATIQIQGYSIKDKDSDSVVEGVMQTQFDSSTQTGVDTFNLVFFDNTLNLVGKVEDLKVTSVSIWHMTGPSHNDSLSGRLFLAAYGYVDIETTAPLIYDSESSDAPSGGGPVLIHGKQNTRLTLIPKSSTLVKLELDHDGNDVNDSATLLAWHELSSTPTAVNLPPVAVAGTDQAVDKGSVVTVDGGASYDPNFDFLTLYWSLVQTPAGSQVKLTATGATTASFQPDVVGHYVLRLIANDGQLESTPATVSISAMGKFTMGPALAPRREVLHTSTRLTNGKVLIAGGPETLYPYIGYSDTSTLYDPASGTFSASGKMALPHTGHAATLLPDGRVLIAGGTDVLHPIAELYDPDTGKFSTLGNMLAARRYHTATLLADGKVLIAGGNLLSKTPSAELYDPNSGQFTLTGGLITPRIRHTATLLPNGKVLIVGGIAEGGNSSTPTAELYDPVTRTFSATGSLNVSRVYHTATLLPNGGVLIAGGQADDISNPGGAEFYDPVTGKFTIVADMVTPRTFHTATLLPNGMVLIAGGYNRAKNIYLLNAEFYDPVINRFFPGGKLNIERAWATATLLANGQVLMAGGTGVGPDGPRVPLPSDSTELFSY